MILGLTSLGSMEHLVDRVSSKSVFNLEVRSLPRGPFSMRPAKRTSFRQLLCHQLADFCQAFTESRLLHFAGTQQVEVSIASCFQSVR